MRRFLHVGAAALLISILSACGGETETGAVELTARAARVRLATTEQRALQRTLEVGGVASAWQSARLAPLGQGEVASISVELGELVTEGQELARLDTQLLRLQLNQANSGVELARLQLQDASREATRAASLGASGAVSGQNRDRAQLGAQVAQAQLSQAEAAISLLRAQINRSRVRAPFDGRVTGIYAEEGEFFTGMAGMGGGPALVAVADLTSMRLDVQIPERDVVRVQPGMAAIVTSDVLPGEEFQATIQAVNPAAEQGTRTFTARLRVPNADERLRPGMFLTARLVIESQDGLVVPHDAVVGAQSENPRVALINGEAATWQNVELGLRGDDGWLITDGLAAGQGVVVEGQFGLGEGSAVQVVE